ncbi:hypothetical protein KIW84_054754 [Lathyrus oleraceus]|uniref:WLM domain-containing protein n=1 Tax=Pisum sativum TaxID=3888 RepID=A0A9D5AHV1_PEA|nr:hypothetical protein KIW84_054754 [Pisum sativum]
MGFKLLPISEPSQVFGDYIVLDPLDELRKECAELMANRITRFDLPGRRLGGYSTQPPLSSLRKTALSAAEKRPWLGYRIGGDWLIMTTLTPRQAAAMAAERRLQDD